jgi:hypothetical protein
LAIIFFLKDANIALWELKPQKILQPEFLSVKKGGQSPI